MNYRRVGNKRAIRLVGRDPRGRQSFLSVGHVRDRAGVSPNGFPLLLTCEISNVYVSALLAMSRLEMAQSQSWVDIVALFNSIIPC